MSLSPHAVEQRSPRAVTTEPTCPRACALQLEKPLLWEACTLHLESSPRRSNQSPHTAVKTQDSHKDAALILDLLRVCRKDQLNKVNKVTTTTERDSCYKRVVHSCSKNQEMHAQSHLIAGWRKLGMASQSRWLPGRWRVMLKREPEAISSQGQRSAHSRTVYN